MNLDHGETAIDCQSEKWLSRFMIPDQLSFSEIKPNKFREGAQFEEISWSVQTRHRFAGPDHGIVSASL